MIIIITVNQKLIQYHSIEVNMDSNKIELLCKL